MSSHLLKRKRMHPRAVGKSALGIMIKAPKPGFFARYGRKRLSGYDAGKRCGWGGNLYPGWERSGIREAAARRFPIDAATGRIIRRPPLLCGRRPALRWI